MFEKPRWSLLILVLLFLVPQSFFVIGDYIAIGFRFPLFRIQLVFQSIAMPSGEITTFITPSIITVVRELEFISMGAVGSSLGKTAVATYIWLAGAVLLVAAAVLVLTWQVLENPSHAPYPGPLIIAAGALFILWAMVQFGILFSGPVGYSIPIGIPFLWYCGYQFMKAGKEAALAGAAED